MNVTSNNGIWFLYEVEVKQDPLSRTVSSVQHCHLESGNWENSISQTLPTFRPMFGAGRST